MEQLFTWEMVVTLAGCSAATAFITQGVKHFFTNLNPRVVSSIIGMLLMVAATAFTTTSPSFAEFVMAVINGVIIGFASNGEYDTFSKREK